MTTNDDAQLAALRQSTVDLITWQGQSIALVRPSQPVPDGAGGFKANTASPTTGTPVRRFLSRVRADAPDIADAAGQRRIQSFVLIGVYNDDIAEGDYFLEDGIRWNIDAIEMNRDYQTKAFGRVISSGI